MKLNRNTIDEIIQKRVISDIPGTALLIGQSGKIIFQKGYGFADIENNIPVGVDTPFIIASITKQFITMAIMILKEKGLICYKESISRFFPDFPMYKDKVTIEHLMTHTSGIKDYFPTEGMEEFVNNKGNSLTQYDVLDIIKDLGDLEFEPGTRFAYSNSAYVMLGIIIEKISGMTFCEFLKKSIFEPLNMNLTVAPESYLEVIENLAVGYKKDTKNQFEREPYNNVTIGWADGNMVSTIGDLFKWHNALYTEKLVKKETLEEAYKPFILENGESTNYGFGFWLNDRRGVREVWHTGLTIGYTLRFSRFIEEDIVVIMLTNLSTAQIDDTFNSIVELVLEEKLKPVKYTVVDESKLGSKVGKYEGRSSLCNITYDNELNKLRLEYEVCNDALIMSGNVTLSPINEKLFRLDSSDDYYIEFDEKDEDLSRLTFDFHGYKQYFHK
ncbi:serine hydrolase [Wukongibacter baidiensis]|uniref:serine hydrolase n=1 Tax=Wukongibacter baidiensis TaxID=1723361 RepID=UPI003D7F6143